MGGNRCALVELKRVLLPIQLVKGPDGVKYVGLYQRRAKAAVVLSVVDQQRGARRAHGNQGGVVLPDQEIRRVLLDVARFARQAFQPSLQVDEAGDGNRDFHSRVKTAQDNGLPPSSGKPRHAQPAGIDIGALREIVEPAAHGQVEQAPRRSVRPDQAANRTSACCTSD